MGSPNSSRRVGRASLATRHKAHLSTDSPSRHHLDRDRCCPDGARARRHVFRVVSVRLGGGASGTESRCQSDSVGMGCGYWCVLLLAGRGGGFDAAVPTSLCRTGVGAQPVETRCITITAPASLSLQYTERHLGARTAGRQSAPDGVAAVLAP